MLSLEKEALALNDTTKDDTTKTLRFLPYKNQQGETLQAAFWSSLS
jgi:hypothetical protein